MSLIDELRQVGRYLPNSHHPSDGELKGVVGAIAVLLEHGPDYFKQIQEDESKLRNLLSTGDPNVEPATPEETAAADAAALQVRDQEILELKQQVQNLIANLQKTQVGPVE